MRAIRSVFGHNSSALKGGGGPNISALLPQYLMPRKCGSASDSAGQ
jgi:hypothetical protein